MHICRVLYVQEISLASAMTGNICTAFLRTRPFHDLFITRDHLEDYLPECEGWKRQR